VRALVGANGESVLPDSAGDEVRLTFANGQISGSTGCNSVFGTYKQSGTDGADLRFPREDLGSTLVGCTDEPPLIARLLAVRHVSGSPGVRYLHAEDWMIVVELRRSRGETTAPPGPSMWDRHLRDAMTPLGVTGLSVPEHDYAASNMVGSWRGHAVKVAYYQDPVHGIDPQRSGVDGTTTTLEIAGHPVVKVQWKGYPAQLLSTQCGRDYYEVTVFEGSSPYETDPEPALTVDLMTALLESPACS